MKKAVLNNLNSLRVLKSRKKEIEAELQQINKAILALEPKPINFVRWKIKGLECMDSFKHYVQTIEVFTCVFYNDKKTLNDKTIRRKHITALSVALLDLVKTGKVISFRIDGTKGHFYGFPEWFNEDYSLKDEYISKEMRKMKIDFSKPILSNRQTA